MAKALINITCPQCTQ